MTVLAADTYLVAHENEVISIPMLDNVKIYKGSLVTYNANGWAIAAADTASTVFAGVAEHTADNTVTGHTNGFTNVKVRTGLIVTLPGSSFTQASVGTPAFVADSGSVLTTATNYVYVGMIIRYNSATSVDVSIPRGGGPPPLASNSSRVVGTGGATFTGATFNANASSNFNSHINDGTSTGTVNVGNSLAGAVVIASGANSSFIVTGGSLTLQTLTSGAVVINSVGALTITHGSASTWSMTGALTFSGGLVIESSAASVAFGATMALVVASNTITVAATHTTSATATINCAAAAPAGAQITLVITEGAGTGTVVTTFGTHFKSAGTLTTASSGTSAISFAGDGTNWNETGRGTTLS